MTLAILVAEAWVLPLLSLPCSTVNFIYLCFWFTISYFLLQVNWLLVLAKLPREVYLCTLFYLFMNINELAFIISELPVNIPGFSQLSNGRVRVCWVSWISLRGLLLKHLPLGLRLRGMGKGCWIFISMPYACSGLKPEQNGAMNLINPHWRLMNDVGVPIGVNESH